MRWCQGCGAQYDGPTHNCGWVTMTKDRYRELVEAEKSRIAEYDDAENPDGQETP